MASKAEALVMIIDVSPSMNESIDGKGSLLEKCVMAANMIIQRKMFADTKATKNEAALLLFGTDGTLNSLYEDGVEGYEHITVAKEMGVMDLELLTFINNNIQPGNSNGDFIDALVVAVDHLHNKCIGRKMEQKVILFTNLDSEFADDKLEVIIKAFNGNDINLVFVGPELDDNEDVGSKKVTYQQELGMKCIRHILEQVDGEGISANEVLPLLSFFETRRRKQVTSFRGPIEIGSSLKINSYAYVKTQQENPSSWKKSSALAEYAASANTLKVEMERTYNHNDEDQTEVTKENIAQAYRYGKTLVPMTQDDKKSIKLETTRGCLVLGFTSQDNVKRNLYSRKGSYIFTPQPDDEHAAVAFSALCHSLEEKNMVAIVRFVSRGGTDPKIGFLSPHIKSSYESLIFVALPYREDIRQYSFASLTSGKHNKVSTEQQEAVDSLVDNMLLIRKVKDEEDNEYEEELIKPKNILNPVTQRQCQCIQSRALNPEQIRIPEIEEYILKSITPIPEMVANCHGVFEKIEERFPLEEVKKKNQPNIFKRLPENDVAEKKLKLDDDITDEFSLHRLSKSHVTEIGTADPIGDFDILTEGATKERFSEICNKMKSCVLKFVMDSFLDQYYAKALDCIKRMKERCVEKKISSVFNEMLLELKQETLGKRRNDFWELLKKEDIKPISQTEADDSLHTEEQVINFFLVTGEKPKTDVTNYFEEDEDDLFDML